LLGLALLERQAEVDPVPDLPGNRAVLAPRHMRNLVAQRRPRLAR
jgi:hypothetical protein